MPQQFVKIVNRGTYTNPAKAQHYVRRGLAIELLVHRRTRQPLEIVMLDDAALACLRSPASRACREANHDDGIPRRFVSRPSAGIPVKQLLPTAEVGTGARVTKRRDMLMRPQHRIGEVRTVTEKA